MVVLFLFFYHVICYIVSNILRVIIYNYIKKKPLGLQSILDPLILDIVRCQIANYAYFMLLLISALAHGQLPFLLSQVIIFISVTLNNYMYGLCLYYLVIKALVIYKGSWILEISDTTIVRLSRILAVIVVNLQHLGDSWLRKPAPGVLTKLLTGTDQQTYLRSGLFQLTLVLALLVTIIILQVKKLAASTEEAKEERKMLLAALPWSFFIVIAFTVLQKTVTSDQVGRFMLTSVVLSSLQQIIPLYFILTLPKLKAFAIETCQSFFTNTLIGRELAFWSYVLCPGRCFTIELRGNVRQNQVLPI